MVLCGTQYGATYVPALVNDWTGFRLSALVARGSPASRRLATACEVPLHRSIDEIAEPFDVACVVVGGVPGEQLARGFLQRKIPVVLEHPVSPAALQGLLQTARRARAVLHVNIGFGELPTIKELVRRARRLAARQQPKLVLASCGRRTLYSLLDILARALGPASLRLKGMVEGLEYQQREMLWGEVPLSLALQRSLGAVDDGSDTFIGHRITFGFPSGNLTLAGTGGPLLWWPAGPMSAWQLLPPSQPAPFYQARAQANLTALQRLARHLRAGHEPPEQTSGHLRAVAAACAKLTPGPQRRKTAR